MLLDGLDLDTLDAAQRNALYEHVIAGGIVLLCAPSNTSPLLDTWLGPHLPVYPIARRTATDISSPVSGHRLGMRTRVSICEATLAEGNAIAVVEENGFVHAAYSKLGLGRIVFTSFPINGLDAKGVEVETLWKALVPARMGSADGQIMDSLARSTLGGMMGSSTPSWGSAAVVACGYLIAILASVGGLLCRDRVRAFGLAASVALVASTGIFLWTGFRQNASVFSQARWTVTDVGSQGALRTEYVSWHGGTADGISLAALDERTCTKPLDESALDHAEISMMPLAARGKRFGGGSTPLIWSAESTLDSAGISATAHFTQSGLILSVNNQLGQPLNNPAVLWHQQIPVPSLPAGTSEVPVPVGEQSTGTQQVSIRNAILASLLVGAPSSADTLLLTGWLDDANQHHELLQINARDAHVTSKQYLHLLRVPAQVKPSPVGSDVWIDGAFNSLVLLQRDGCPYDPLLQRWLPGTQSGQWLLGFKPPSAIGRLAPNRVILNLDATAPRQRIRFQASQCAGGRPTPNADGPIVADWSEIISRRSISFPCSADDFDENGCVWLLVTVDSPPAFSAASWLIRSLDLTYEARVVGHEPR